MYDVISLVLVALVVAAGVAGLFGGRRRSAAMAGPGGRPAGPRTRRPAPGRPASGRPASGRPAPGGSAGHTAPPAYRIVRPDGPVGSGPASPVPAGPVGVPAGPVGVHDGATRVFPAMAGPDEPGPDEPAGPDPQAVLLARSGPSGDAGRR